MKNEDAKIRRINMLARRIQRILCKNDQTGSMMADDQDNNDAKMAPFAKRSVKLETVKNEMGELKDMIRAMEDLVEDVEDPNVELEFRNAIEAFENTRKDILGEVKDRIRERDPGKGMPATRETSLIALEGGIDDLSEWA